jgi:hypothetical protein
VIEAVHEPTAKNLRERVEGPVVVWDLPHVDQLARALAVADVVNTWLRPELFTVVVARSRLDGASAEALRQFASSLNLTLAWIISAPEAGQREALAQRALLWLNELPSAPLASIAEAVDALVGQRLAT